MAVHYVRNMRVTIKDVDISEFVRDVRLEAHVGEMVTMTMTMMLPHDTQYDFERGLRIGCNTPLAVPSTGRAIQLPDEPERS